MNFTSLFVLMAYIKIFNSLALSSIICGASLSVSINLLGWIGIC